MSRDGKVATQLDNDISENLAESKIYDGKKLGKSCKRKHDSIRQFSFRKKRFYDMYRKQNV